LIVTPHNIIDICLYFHIFILANLQPFNTNHMKTRKFHFSCLMAILLFSLQVFPNNINVQNVSLEGQVAAEDYVYVEFDLSWDNSWRTVAVPENWDAAWVFIKYSVAGGEWHHATLDTVDLYAPSGSTVDVSYDSVGAYIYRSVNGSGTNTWNNIRLRWEYGIDGVADDAYLDIKVFAIEMVYIPESDFYLGDGAAVSGRFQEGNTGQPFLVTSESAMPTGPGSGDINLVGGTFAGYDPIPANYPKGHKAFYCMKYEISQEQYVEFLNTLTRTQQDTRTKSYLTSLSVGQYVMSNSSVTVNRQGIWCDPPPPAPDTVFFYCNGDTRVEELGEGECLPLNWITWMHMAAYLDWSGLRPMTEMEFEKVCRGPNTAVANEYAWGTTNIFTNTLSVMDRGLASEYISNMITVTGYACHVGVKGYMFRCGIFAASAPNKTRQETGAAFYGVMEMSGNLKELVVSAYHHSGMSFTGVHGNGVLTSDGDANEDHWPGINGNTNYTSPNGTYSGGDGVTGDAGSGLRGGGWKSETNYLPRLETSNRMGVNVGLGTGYGEDWGGRGVRTAD